MIRGRRKTPQQVFTGVAPIYDAFNNMLSMGRAAAWRSAAARALIAEGDLFLDVGTGTGRMAMTLDSRGRRASPTAPGGIKVVGCDINQSMLKRSRLALPHRSVLADAKRLPFEAATFSGVSLAFSLADMDAPVAALTECRRVLKPGGSCVLLELAVPPGWMGRVYVPLLRLLVTIAAKLAGAEGLRSLALEISEYPGPEWMTQTISCTGLELIESRPLDFGVARLYVARAPYVSSPPAAGLAGGQTRC
jgi:demethylmenaquinone methyltransferase/2-methoxy-6-polyprenyl-1,4-benzoquinol methylase